MVLEEQRPRSLLNPYIHSQMFKEHPECARLSSRHHGYEHEQDWNIPAIIELHLVRRSHSIYKVE